MAHPVSSTGYSFGDYKYLPPSSVPSTSVPLTDTSYYFPDDDRAVDDFAVYYGEDTQLWDYNSSQSMPERFAPIRASSPTSSSPIYQTYDPFTSREYVDVWGSPEERTQKISNNLTTTNLPVDEDWKRESWDQSMDAMNYLLDSGESSLGYGKFNYTDGSYSDPSVQHQNSDGVWAGMQFTEEELSGLIDGAKLIGNEDNETNHKLFLMDIEALGHAAKNAKSENELKQIVSLMKLKNSVDELAETDVSIFKPSTWTEREWTWAILAGAGWMNSYFKNKKADKMHEDLMGFRYAELDARVNIAEAEVALEAGKKGGAAHSPDLNIFEKKVTSTG